MTTQQQQRQQLFGKMKWLLDHPVIGAAVFEEGASVVKVPGQRRRAAAHALSGRPDLGEQIRNSLRPIERSCPHCSAQIPASDDRCKSCGKFVPDPNRTLKAEVDALMTHPGGEDFNAEARVRVGMPAYHTTSGFSGKAVALFNGIAVLRDPSGVTVRVAADEVEAQGSVSSVPMPGGSWGGYAGAPASNSKATHSRLAKGVHCAVCGHALTQGDINEGECPECGADLSDNIEDDDCGYQSAPAALQQAYYASSEGMLKLAKRIRPGHVPNMFARAAGSSGLRKGGSIPLARGTRVVHKRTGRVGHVLRSGAFEACVEYATAKGSSLVLEKLSELRAN